MKTIFLTIALFLGINSFSQNEEKNKNNYTLVAGYKSHYNGSSLEFGIANASGNMNKEKIGDFVYFRDWDYFSKFATFEYKFGAFENEFDSIHNNNNPSLYSINIGATFGTGFLVTIPPIPGSAYATLGLNSDFRNLNLLISGGIDIVGLNIGMGYLISLTANNQSFGDAKEFIEIKYTFGMFN